MKYGALQYGATALGGGVVHDLPTVSVTAPTGTTSTGGPSLTVSWTYAQAQNDPQAAYRVQITNAAGTTVYFDSGWLGGASTSYVVSDLVAAGVPTDTTGTALRAVVAVRSNQGDAFEKYSSPQSFDVQWGVVTATATGPAEGASVTSSTVTATWTYSSTRSKAQASYRVRLLAASSGYVFYDSGFITGTGTSLAIPTVLVNGSSYRVEVTLKNTEGVIGGPDTNTFTAALPTVASATALPAVGRIYEVGIDGVGYMLADGHPDQAELSRRRQVISLDPPRLATTETPFAEAIERYTFFAGSDFRSGAGQVSADRPASDPAAFYTSDGVNPFEPGQVTLLKATAQEVANTSVAAQWTVLADDRLYTVTGASQLKYLSTPGGSTTTLNITKGASAAVTIEHLASDGQRWYAAAGADGILRGQTTDPAGVWSTVQGRYLGWAGGRLCASVIGSGSTPNRFTTLVDSSGAEEVAGGRITLPAGWTIRDFTSGNGYVWFTAYTTDRGAIYKWDLSSATPSVAWELPIGERPILCFWHQGRVYVRTSVVTGSSSADKARLYSCDIESGNLVPTYILELDTAAAKDSVSAFGGLGRFVYFGWGDHGDGYAGLGAIDAATGGYAKWLKGPSSTTPSCYAIVPWRGRIFFSVESKGLYGEAASTYVTTGYLSSSIHDGASNLEKTWDSLTVRCLPLPGSTSVTAALSVDGGNSYTTLTGLAFSTAGQTVASTTLGDRAQSAGVRITLAGSGSATPTLTLWQLQAHPAGKADVVLRLPIDCSDTISGLNGRPLPDNGPGTGTARAQALESLMLRQVLVQDVDWATTGYAETFEVIQVDRVPMPGVLRDRQQGRASGREVVMVTLRRSLL